MTETSTIGGGPAAGSGDPAETGSARFLEPVSRNLFVGRDALIDEARRLLRTADGRLVNLVGTGGVGKTRLLQHVAELEAASGDWPDDVILVRLDSLPPADDDLLESHILDKLGIQDNAEVPGMVRLMEHFRGRRALLLLDNCEHLLGADYDGPVPQLLRTLLPAARNLTVMTTSRTRFVGIVDEQALDVPPLPTADAVRLLIDRAAKAGAAAKVRAESSETLAELCDLLGGLPLAIELVAARLASMTVSEILTHTDLLSLLKAAAATQDNHRTMDATIGWSYSLLDAREKDMLTSASVFEGGFDLDAAHAVCAGNDIAPGDVQELLSKLETHSLLPHEVHEGQSRYQMLELIRQFGKKVAETSGRSAQLLDAHAAYYAARAEHLAGVWFGPDETDSLDWVQVNVPNSHVAQKHLLASPETATLGRQLGINTVLTLALVKAGQINRNRQFLAPALAAHPAADPSIEQGMMLSLMAWMLLIRGARAQARPLLDQAVEVAQRLGCEDTFGPLINTQATWLWLAEDDVDVARGCLQLFRRAADALQEAGAPPGARWMNGLFLGISTAFYGSAEDAFAESGRVLNGATAVQAPWCISWGLWNCALAQLLHGDPVEAAKLAQEALRIQRLIGDRWGPAWTKWLLALIAMRLGHHELGAEIMGSADVDQRDTLASVEGLGSFWRVQQVITTAAEFAIGERQFQIARERGRSRIDEEQEKLEKRALEPMQPRVHAEPLTDRELEVAELVAQGLRYADIATRLGGLSVRTVEAHARNAREKLGFSSRSELADWYRSEAAATRSDAEKQAS